MHKAFSHPPATLHDTYVSALQEYGLSLIDLSAEEVKLLRSLVSYSYLCAVARITAVVPASQALGPKQDAVAFHVLGESMQVLQEVAQFNEDDAPQERRLHA